MLTVIDDPLWVPQFLLVPLFVLKVLFSPIVVDLLPPAVLLQDFPLLVLCDCPWDSPLEPPCVWLSFVPVVLLVFVPVDTLSPLLTASPWFCPTFCPSWTDCLDASDSISYAEKTSLRKAVRRSLPMGLARIMKPNLSPCITSTRRSMPRKSCFSLSFTPPGTPASTRQLSGSSKYAFISARSSSISCRPSSRIVLPRKFPSKAGFRNASPTWRTGSRSALTANKSRTNPK